jgi:hypothetical protein
VTFEEMRVKRRIPPQGSGKNIVPALPATSVILAKVPAMRAFVTDTAYEDGSPRVPGYFTLRNRVACFEVTLYDPDSGCRLPVRGSDLDKALQMAEQLLGVEEAPWEVDQYLLGQLEQRGRKKKK